MTDRSKTHYVRPYARGQITIPIDFRNRLGIDENTVLELRLAGSKIEITPLKLEGGDRLLREYNTAEIEDFLDEDKIDEKTAAKARKLLGG